MFMILWRLVCAEQNGAKMKNVTHLQEYGDKRVVDAVEDDVLAEQAFLEELRGLLV